MDKSKGVAYCGLACCVCSENANCAGCRNEGCKDKDSCKSYSCCRQKGIAGCWECADFPCENPMLDKLRVRTFAKFIGKYGDDALMDALNAGEKAGLCYHHPGKLTGDYDTPTTEQEITDMLLKLLKR